MKDLRDIMEIVDDLEKEKDELKEEVLRLRKELEISNNKFDGQTTSILNFIRRNPNVSLDFEELKQKLYGPAGCKEFVMKRTFFLTSSYTGSQLEVNYG